MEQDRPEVLAAIIVLCAVFGVCGGVVLHLGLASPKVVGAAAGVLALFLLALLERRR